MRLRWLLILTLLAAGSGCCSALRWKDFQRILPRETPRMAVARFQVALLYGPYSDSFESLTKKSREKIGIWVWRLFIPRQEDPETGVRIWDIMAQSKVDACVQISETKALVYTFYDEVGQAYTVKLFFEDGEWKIGVVETFLGEDYGEE